MTEKLTLEERIARPENAVQKTPPSRWG